MFTKNDVVNYARTVHSLGRKKAANFARNFLFANQTKFTKLVKGEYEDTMAEGKNWECWAEERLTSPGSIAWRAKRGRYTRMRKPRVYKNRSIVPIEESDATIEESDATVDKNGVVNLTLSSFEPAVKKILANYAKKENTTIGVVISKIVNDFVNARIAAYVNNIEL